MDEQLSFAPDTLEAIGNYVYRLIDPRNGETFYVGKGKENRVFYHVNLSSNLVSENEDPVSLKIARITAIRNSFLRVIHVIHRHDIPDAAVFEVEAALIDAFPGLTNVQGGYGSDSKGPMSPLELDNKYSRPTISEEPAEKLVLININRIEDKSTQDSIYRQTQLAWRISKERAEKADYVLAVVRGVVIGAFIADKWLNATHENFPERISPDGDMLDRKGFIGRTAPQHILEKFVGDTGKRIAIDSMKHVQYPIRYWRI